MTSYDGLLREVGEFGLYQKVLLSVIIFSSVPNAIPTLMFIFVHFTPEYRCVIPGQNSTLLFDDSVEELRNILTPRDKNGDFDECRRYNYSTQEIAEFVNMTKQNKTIYASTNKTTKCVTGWKFGNHIEGLYTFTMEMELICDKSWIPAMANSAVMLGMFLAAFVGQISDRYGRKPVFLVSTAAQFITHGIVGLAWNTSSYVALNLLLGFFNVSNFLSLFIIGTETVLPKHRNILGLSLFYAFSMGYPLVACLAYYITDWRQFMFVSAGLGVLYIPVIWLVPESPRWLIQAGKMERARAVLNKIAKTNSKKSVNKDCLESMITLEKEQEVTELKRGKEIVLCLKDKVVRTRIIVMCLQWLVVCITYYEIAYNIPYLSGNRFINAIIAGVVEVPSYILSYYLIKWIGGVRTYSLSMTITAACCTVLPFFKSEQKILLNVTSMLGKLGANMGFYMVYILVGEISPTMIRNLSTTLASSFGRVGGFIAPYFVYIGVISSLFIPYWMMAFLTAISTVLTLLYIPETRGVPLPKDVADARGNQRIYGMKFWKSFSNEDKSKRLSTV